MPKRISLAVLIILIAWMASNRAFAFDIAKIPDFQDGQWIFLQEENEGVKAGNKTLRWGKSRKYRLKEDPGIVGNEIFAFDGGVCYKNWGRKEEAFFSHALKFLKQGASKDFEEFWIPSPPGSTARAGGQLNEKTEELMGLWFEIHFPSGKIVGSYIPNPAYKARPESVKKKRE